MHVIKQILFYLFLVLCASLISLTLLSLVYDLPFWYSKVLDFPRQQYLILGMAFLFLFFLFNRIWNLPSFLLLSGLIAVIIIQGRLIYPYVLGEKTVQDYETESLTPGSTFDIIIANVLITNREFEKFRKIVHHRDPDILLVMEVNDEWTKELQIVKKNYPYAIEYPLNNAYGMSLYSKLPLQETEIKFLKHEDVPSIHAKILLPSGDLFTFHGVHPVAPVPSERYPDNVGEEEVALLKIGELVARDTLNSMVAGDFNDVSWSRTSRMFGKQGSLKNVRLGRGLFNTFDATSPILRWPLDHYFVTVGFSVVKLERLSSFGSDHFPLYAKFVFTQ